MTELEEKLYAAADRERYLKMLDEIEKGIAQKAVKEHIWEGILFLFNFKFINSIGAFRWAYERLTKTGDYDPKVGSFYRKGYLK